MLPNREGRFKASILDHAIAETGPNHLATFICKFGLAEEQVNGEWTPLGPEDAGFAITGYFYLEKRDGSINTIIVDQLKAAFGWDGRDPMWLQDSDFTGLAVQVKLEYDTYDGKQRLKVRYVDAADAQGGGGVPRADDSVRAGISARLGSKLRALAGGTPVSTPRPAGRPAMPTAPKAVAPAKPAARPAAPAKSPADEAWEAWSGMNEDLPADAVEAEWFKWLGIVFPGQSAANFTTAQWVAVRDRARAMVKQLGGAPEEPAPVIVPDDIPF